MNRETVKYGIALFVLVLLLSWVTCAQALDGVHSDTSNVNNRVEAAYADTTGKDTLTLGVVPEGFFIRDGQDHLGRVRYMQLATTYPQIDTLKWWFNSTSYKENKRQAFYDTDAAAYFSAEWTSAMGISVTPTDSTWVWFRLVHPDSTATGLRLVNGEPRDIFLEVSWSDASGGTKANRDSGYWEVYFEWYVQNTNEDLIKSITELRQKMETGNSYMEKLVRNTNDLKANP